MPAPEISIGNEWKLAVAPTVAKLKLAAVLKQSFILNSVGAGALATLLHDMSDKLDIAIAYIDALDEKSKQP